MAVSDGDIAGYFIALLVLITVIPLAFLTYGFYRRQNKHFIKLDELFQCAMDTIIDERSHVIQEFALEQKSSFASKIQSALTDSNKKKKEDMNTSLIDDNTEIKSWATKYYRMSIRQGAVYWGIRDILVKNGELSFLSIKLKLPPGLVEDFIFHVCNSINPLTLAFSDVKNDPNMLFTRFIIYCNAQAFALFLYLSISNPTTRLIIDFMLSPLILFFEKILILLLTCPCLIDINDDDDQKNQKLTMKHVLRAMGGLLSIPLLGVLILLLIIIASELAHRNIDSLALLQFIWDGIIFAIILRIFLTSIKFWYFMKPTHVKVCNLTILRINYWTEQKHQINERQQYLQCSDEERRKIDVERELRIHQNNFGMCYQACCCCRLSFPDTDYAGNSILKGKDIESAATSSQQSNDSSEVTSHNPISRGKTDSDGNIEVRRGNLNELI